MEWIIANKQWLFSGVGVVIIAAIIRYFWSKNRAEKETNTDRSINQSMGTNINAAKGNVKFENNKQELNINPDKPKS